MQFNHDAHFKKLAELTAALRDDPADAPWRAEVGKRWGLFVLQQSISQLSQLRIMATMDQVPDHRMHEQAVGGQLGAVAGQISFCAALIAHTARPFDEVDCEARMRLFNEANRPQIDQAAPESADSPVASASMVLRDGSRGAISPRNAMAMASIARAAEGAKAEELAQGNGVDVGFGPNEGRGA